MTLDEALAIARREAAVLLRGAANYVPPENLVPDAEGARFQVMQGFLAESPYGDRFSKSAPPSRSRAANLPSDPEYALRSVRYKAHLVSFRRGDVEEKAWFVSFFPLDDNANIVIAVIVQSPSGEILHASLDFWWGFEKIWEAWGYEPYWFWTPEAKALYHSLHQLQPTRIVPEEGAVAQDEALRLATDAVQQKYGVSDEAMASFRADLNYVPGWYLWTEASGTSAWIIAFRPARETEKGYPNVAQVTLSAADGAVLTCEWDRENE